MQGAEVLEGFVDREVREPDHRPGLHPVAPEHLGHLRAMTTERGEAQPELPVLPAVGEVVVLACARPIAAQAAMRAQLKASARLGRRVSVTAWR